MIEQGLTTDLHLSEFVLQLCMCRNCPTYKNAVETEEWFCDSEPSLKIQREMGCLCGACLQGEEEGLVKLYFCTAGAEGERRTFG